MPNIEIRITTTFDPGPIFAGIDEAWDEATVSATALSKSLAPYDPTADGQPHLKDQISGRVTGHLASMIWSPLYYAGFVEFGTGPHEIRPKNRSALMFTSGGDTIFAKVVHHPGTAAHPFLQPAAEAFVTTLFPAAAAARLAA